jgi:hypothetical protein
MTSRGMTWHRVEIVSSIALLALHFLLWGPRSHIATLEAPIVAALVPWGMHHNHGVKTLSLLVLKVRVLELWEMGIMGRVISLHA